MKGVNYVSNANGETTALLIDLNQLRNSESSLDNFLEDLNDLIVLELLNGSTGRPYLEVSKEKNELEKISIEQYKREVDEATDEVAECK